MQPLRVGGSRPACGWELTVERKGLWVSPQAPPLLPRGPEQILRCLRLPCRPRRSDWLCSHAPSPCGGGAAGRRPAGTPGSERGQRPGASHPVRWLLPPGETPGCGSRCRHAGCVPHAGAGLVGDSWGRGSSHGLGRVDVLAWPGSPHLRQQSRRIVCSLKGGVDSDEGRPPEQHGLGGVLGAGGGARRRGRPAVPRLRPSSSLASPCEGQIKATACLRVKCHR